MCLITGSGRSPGGGHGNPLQHACQRLPWTEEPGGLQSREVTKRRTQTEQLGTVATPGTPPLISQLPGPFPTDPWFLNTSCILAALTKYHRLSGLEKAEELEIKLPTLTGSLKKQEFQKNIYFCFIDYAKAFDCVDHIKMWKILIEMGIPDHLTCLLRNLYAGQEATVRTGHGTTDWFQIGKGVCQGYILSP